MFVSQPQHISFRSDLFPYLLTIFNLLLYIFTELWVSPPPVSNLSLSHISCMARNSSPNHPLLYPHCCQYSQGSVSWTPCPRVFLSGFPSALPLPMGWGVSRAKEMCPPCPSSSSYTRPQKSLCGPVSLVCSSKSGPHASLVCTP